MAPSNRRNRLHEHVTSARPLLGLLQMRVNPLLLESAPECGYGFVILDEQLGVFDEQERERALRSLAGRAEVISMVRAAGVHSTIIRQAIDVGVDAIVMPRVTSAEQARALADDLKSNPRTSLIVIIESVEGAKNAGQILALDGVAGVFIGPINLSTDLGCPREYTHPSYEAAFSGIERAALSAGVLLGTVPNDVYSAGMLAARGHRLLILGSDQMLFHAALLGAARKATNY